MTGDRHALWAFVKGDKALCTCGLQLPAEDIALHVRNANDTERKRGDQK